MGSTVNKRPYPWKCHTCREMGVRPVIVDYTADMDHDGRTYAITVPKLEILECEHCHTRVLPEDAYGLFYDKLREQAGLLAPTQISQNREALHLTQKQLADYLGVAEATISRWENGGQIQQRSLDRFLRSYFAFDPVRRALADESQLTNLGATAQVG